MTDKEIKEIEILALSHPTVKKLLDELLGYHEDPAQIFYLEAKAMVKAITDDMRLIREGKTTGLMLLSNKKDDKIFERVKSLLTDSGKIFEGLKKGRPETLSDINSEIKEIDESESAVDRLVNSKKK